MFKRIVAWCIAVFMLAVYGGMALNASVDPYKESEQIVSGMAFMFPFPISMVLPPKTITHPPILSP